MDFEIYGDWPTGLGSDGSALPIRHCDCSSIDGSFYLPDLTGMIDPNGWIDVGMATKWTNHTLVEN
jgi:hypothetical protein